MPVLIGGSGEKVVRRLVAEHAQMWNGSGPPDEFARKSAILDGWCDRVGRDKREIERTANMRPPSSKVTDEWLKAGLQHFVLVVSHPFDLKAVARLIKESRG